MNTAPVRRRPGRWTPALLLCLSLLATGVAASYARVVVKKQADKEHRDHARFLTAMKHVTDELQRQLDDDETRLRAAAVRLSDKKPDAAVVATTSSEPLGAVRYATSATLADAGEDSSTVAAIRGILNKPRENAAASHVEPALGPRLGGAVAAFLVYVPVYANGPAHRASATRSAKPIGVIYAKLSVVKFGASAIDSGSRQTLRIRLYAALDTAVTGLVYDSGRPGTPGAWQSQLRIGTAVEVLGTPWALMIDALPAFGGTDAIDPAPTVLAAGGLLALVIFGSTLAKARAQRSADETEARYHELFNGTPIPMWLYDTETLRIVAVNDAAVTHYGFSRAEFHALTIKDLRPADDLPALATTLEQPATRYHHARVRRHRIKDGTIIDVEITAHPLRFKGRPAEVIVAHDISERRRAEDALRESEERLRQMADHIKEAFFVVELPSGKTLYVSSTWAEIWGRPMSEASDPQVWFNAIHPDDRGLMLEAQGAIREGKPAVTTFRVIRPDGTLRWVRGRTFPVRNEHGAVYRMVGVSEDITELRQVESRFAQAQKMEAIGQLAGGVAHDFNNLLTVILGEADEVHGALEPDSREARSVMEIRDAGHRAAALTRQLLAFSRRQLIAPVVFDLNEAVKGMSNMFRRLIGENITIVTRFDDATWFPYADPGQIEQVLANLVLNARDAMPQGGTLTVETGNVVLDAENLHAIPDLQSGEYVVMTVSDTGSGMTEAVRARLFEPFFTTKELGKGTGLGLATCYGIVKQAGGYIGVYSEPGLGTTVKVYLPRSSALLRPIRTDARPNLPRGDETILLVEDEDAVRRISVRLLEGQGYTLLEARDGAEAASLLASHTGRIDLLLTDVVLPGLGGREVAEGARVARPGIKVLFASGYSDDMILQHRLLEHDVALLQKPFSREAIARKVRDVLDAPAELATQA